MSKWVLIQNAGEIDPRAFSLLGISVKEIDDPIGMFGSGLNYSVALAAREGVEVVVFSGTKRIEFCQIPTEFRGRRTQRIDVLVEDEVIPTSITTDFGKHDWNDHWLILREFFANAADEGSHVLRLADEDPVGEPGCSRVFIQITPRLRQVVDNLEYYIRSTGLIEETGTGRIYSRLGEKCRIYKQGIFVTELPVSSLYDYDLFDLNLTESRTATVSDIRWAIAELLATCSLERRVEFIKAVTNTQEKLIERDLYYHDWNKSVVQKWREAFDEAFPDGMLCFNPSENVAQSVKASGRTPVRLPDKLSEMLAKDGIPSEDALGYAAKSDLALEPLTEYRRGLAKQAKTVLQEIFGLDIMEVMFFSNTNHPPLLFSNLKSELFLYLPANECTSARTTAVQAFLAACGFFVDNRSKKQEEYIVEKLLPRLGLVV